MQAATELLLSRENFGIYLKLLLLKSWDYKDFTGNISLLICHSEKLEHRKLRNSKTNGGSPCYIQFETVLWNEKQGKLHPCFQYMQSADTVFDTLTAICHKDKMQPMLINRGLAISTHRTSSDLYFQTTDLTLIWFVTNHGTPETWECKIHGSITACGHIAKNSLFLLIVHMKLLFC